MNARRTHALSFLLNSDLQLMSSGRQTGSRLGGWDARPEEGDASPPAFLAPSMAAHPQQGFRAKPQSEVSAGEDGQGPLGTGEQGSRGAGSREGCRFGEGFGYKILE